MGAVDPKLQCAGANLSALPCLSSRVPERGSLKRRREVAAWKIIFKEASSRIEASWLNQRQEIIFLGTKWDGFPILLPLH